jgi:hypothetical protein
MLLKKVDGVWLGARLVIASGLMRAANRLRDAARWVPWRSEIGNRLHGTSEALRWAARNLTRTGTGHA